jgi:hypothetical protein
MFSCKQVKLGALNASFDCFRGSCSSCAGFSFAIPSFSDDLVLPSGLNVTVTPEKSFTHSYSIPNSGLTFSVRNVFPVSTLLATVRNILPASIYCRVSARSELDWQIQNDCGSVVLSVNAAFRKTEKIIPRSEPRYPHLRNNYCQSQLAAGRKEFLRL